MACFSHVARQHYFVRKRTDAWKADADDEGSTATLRKVMKTHPLKSLQTLCLVPLAGLCLAAAAHAQTAPPMASPSMPKNHMQGGMTGSNGMKHSMMSGMDSMNKMSMSGNTDKDFAMMMKIHHQQAVDMSEMELANGKSSAMKAMAKQIIAAQKKEIAKFDAWLAQQK